MYNCIQTYFVILYYFLSYMELDVQKLEDHNYIYIFKHFKPLFKKTHNQQIFLLMHQFIINNKYFLNINELLVNFTIDYKEMASNN